MLVLLLHKGTWAQPHVTEDSSFNNGLDLQDHTLGYCINALLHVGWVNYKTVARATDFSLFSITKGTHDVLRVGEWTAILCTGIMKHTVFDHCRTEKG